MKKFLLVIWIAMVVVFGELEARACTCDLPLGKLTVKQQVKKARAQSQAVFVGKVLEVVRSSESFSVSVKFRVESSWKGKLPRELSLTTGLGNGDCGYPFEIRQKYLVYAYGSDENRLATNICQRTPGLIEAAADLKALGKAKIIVELVR